MDGPTIVGIAAAVIAVGGAISSWKSANRSAVAEERSAKAAEEAVAIERQRFEREESAREEQNAPLVDVENLEGTARWTLAQEGRALVGFIFNHGPDVAILERVALIDGPSGPAEADLSGDELVLQVNEPWQAAIPWPFGAGRLDGPVELHVAFRSGESSYRGDAVFRLRRDGADANGQPRFRRAERQVRRV